MRSPLSSLLLVAVLAGAPARPAAAQGSCVHAVPVIITRDGGLPEAGGRHALMCEPGNVGELQALIEKAARMEFGEYERLCEATHQELMEYLPTLATYVEHCRQLTGRAVAPPR